MSAQLDLFLSRLQKVRATGKGSWIACCSGHDDKTPSMTITEGSDGRVLAHCFSQGCSIEDIANGAGLSVSDLMPENLGYHRLKPVRRSFNAMDVLYAIRSDLTLTLIMAKDIQAGKVISQEDSLNLAKAIGRINVAICLAGGE